MKYQKGDIVEFSKGVQLEVQSVDFIGEFEYKLGSRLHVKESDMGRLVNGPSVTEAIMMNSKMDRHLALKGIHLSTTDITGLLMADDENYSRLLEDVVNNFSSSPERVADRLFCMGYRKQDQGEIK